MLKFSFRPTPRYPALAAVVLLLLTAGPALAGVTAGRFLEICRTGPAEEVAAAIAAGADLKAVDDTGRSPLALAALDEPEAAAAKGQLLLSAGADPNRVNRHGQTPLQAAAARGNMDLARKLLAAGAEAWREDDRGEYPADKARRNPALAAEKMLEMLRAAPK